MIRIGDICTGIGFTRHTDRNGQVCVVEDIIELEEHVKDDDGAIWEPGTYYACKWQDGQYGASEFENLRVERRAA